jgi:hypothetical protein
MTDLSFPEWFPSHLRLRAGYIHAKASAAGQEFDSKVIERLVKAPRMERVWKELEKKKRGTDYFLYRAIPPPGVIDKTKLDGDASLRLLVQHRAMLELFCTVFDIIRHPRLTSIGTLSYSQIAERLRHDAEALKTRPKRRYGRHRTRLKKAAETYAILDAEVMFEPEQIRSMVVEIADFMKERFGGVMHNTVATIASVALDCKISPADIRNWVSYPGKNDKKHA